MVQSSIQKGKFLVRVTLLLKGGGGIFIKLATHHFAKYCIQILHKNIIDEAPSGFNGCD